MNLPDSVQKPDEVSSKQENSSDDAKTIERLRENLEANRNSLTSTKSLQLAKTNEAVTGNRYSLQDALPLSERWPKGDVARGSLTQGKYTRRSSIDRRNSVGFGYPKTDQDEDDEPFFHRRKNPQYYAAVAAHIGALGMGLCIYWTATALPNLQKSGNLGTLSKNQESWISSINFLGALTASPIAGYCLERFGRKKTMLLLTLPFVLGWVIIAAAVNIHMVYIGRFITGLCAFSYPVIVPVYTAEISEVKIRGMLSCLYEMMVNIGGLFIYVIGAFISWRYETAACALVPILGHVMLFFAPESPLYLVRKGKEEEASKALVWLRGAKDQEEIKSEFIELKMSVKRSDDGANSGWNFMYLKESSTLKPTLICMFVITLLQTSFINVIMAATVQILESTGSKYDEYLYTIILGIIQLAATAVPFFIVDRVGRRILLLFALAFITLSLSILGGFFHAKRIDEVYAQSDLHWMPLFSLVVYVIACSVGLTTLVYVIIGEVIPPKTKGLSATMTGVWARITGFIVLYMFRDLIQMLGHDGAYWFIAGLNALGFVISFLVIPETKGKSLDEINDGF